MGKKLLLKNDFSTKPLSKITSRLAIKAVFFMFFLSFSGNAQTTTVTISTTGASTWTVPAGVTGSITVEAWGAGGSGGGCSSGKDKAASGGTGGTYVSSTFSGVIAGTVYNLYVAPQTAGVSASNGNNGADSWFNTNLILNANGGLGGLLGDGAAVTAVTTGSIGTTKIAGGSTAAGTGAFGTAGGAGGNSGGSGGGNTANPANGSALTGNPGSAAGGGGGGGATGGGSCGCTSTGGAGARGEIRITYTNPVCTTPTAQPTALTFNTITSGSLNGSFTAAVPAPVNYLVVVNTTGTAPVLTNGTSYTIGSTVLGGTNVIVDNDTDTAFTSTGLSSSTLYYYFIFSFNTTICTGGPIYYTTTPLNGSTTTLAASYCTPTYTSGDSLGDEITNVTLGALTNTTGASLTPYYTFYNAVTIPNLLQSSTASVSVSVGSDGNQYVGVWIDFNQDGTFQTTEGFVSANAGANGTAVINIPVPAGATLGNTRMRVRGGNDSVLLTSQACGASSSGYGETEDYIVNIITAVACTTPTAQPTALSLTPSGNTIAGTFTLASPVASNYLVVINTTGIAPTPTNLTAYTIGSTVGAGNTVVDIDSNGAFTATGLSPLTTYYIFVFSYNSACSGGPLYYTVSPLNGNTTTLTPAYCTPTGNLSCTVNDYISKVIFNTLNNTSTCSAGGYINYAATGAQTTSLMKGSSYNLSLSVGAGSGTHGAGVWIDFNQNGVFSDAGEFFLVSNAIAASSTTTISIAIPVGANTGVMRMRVRYGYAATVVSTMSCTMSGTYGETEDYTITLVAASPCATPTAQATALVLSPTGNAIGGSFTLASPAADNYLVIINTTGAVPAPANGTTYTVGGTVGAGNTVIDIDNNTTFTAIGLSPLTTYYVFVFSYNSLCTGGPLYNITSPLNGSTITTVASSYCSPSVTAGYEDNGYVSNVSFVGTLNDTSNNSTYSSSPVGYQDFTALANKSRQAQGEGVNIFVQALNSSYMKGWVDWNRDGDFADTGELVYDTGGVATYSTTFGFIIPPATALGDYRVRIRINSRDSSPPYDASSTPTYTSCGNINYPGETEDYLFTVVASCTSLITSVTDGVVCGSGTVVLNATGPGILFRWYTSLTGGAAVATTVTGIWTTPSLAATTTYYVTADNGCESLVRTAVVANVNPVPILNFTPSSPIVCGENIVIALNAAGDKQQTYLINENFETGGLGVFSNTNYVSNGGAIDGKTAWQNRPSTFVPVEQVWFPAISSGFGTNKFAIATSDVGSYSVHNGLLSPTMNSTNYLDLTLTFKAYYSRYYIDGSAPTLDYVTVDVSTNGGSTWTELTRYTSDIGIGTRFESKSFNMNAYINQPNLKVRIRYYGEWVDGIAIDDVKLYGFIPLNTGFNWTSATPVNAFSDAGCTIPYIPFTPIATVYVKPTLIQLESGTYDFTANAILSNGCSASQVITVTNTSKVWQNLSSDWNDSNNWKPLGVPTSANCVIIPNHSIISGGGYNAYAKNLMVKSTGILDILSDNNLTVTDWVTVDAGGTFNVKKNASLVQINNVANTGIMNMERTANMRRLDYVYWASPVASFASSAISPGTPGYIYKWTPTIGANTNGWGNWAGGNESMTLGKGYIVRGPDSFTTTLANYTANFSGVPNNGIITTPINRGTYDGADYATTASATLATKNDDNWNLIGNPYPSAVNAVSFLTANTNLDGFIKIWTHGTLPSTSIADPFYNNYVYNYSSSDYITYNASGSSFGPGAFGGAIAAGQGFFVLMNHTSAAASENVTFTNSMRSSAYSNNQFFRNTVDSENGNEKNRIWLDLVSPTNTSIRTLVGYIGGATNSKDRLYDAIADTKANFNIYSITDNVKVCIQGRALPFDNTDTVPISVKVPQNGIYSFAIAATDGLFNNTNQNIFIEDILTGIIHNLRNAPYSFTAQAGSTDNRFVLRYTDNTLGTDSFDLTNTVKVTVNEKVIVRSSDQPIKNIDVFDILGRKIDSYKNVDATQFTLNQLNKTTTTLIIKITLENDAVVTQKIIY